MTKSSGNTTVAIVFSVSVGTVRNTFRQGWMFVVRTVVQTVVTETVRRTLFVEKRDVLNDLSACLTLSTELDRKSEGSGRVKHLTLNDCFSGGRERRSDSRGSGSRQSHNDCFVFSGAFGVDSGSHNNFLMNRKAIKVEND